MEQHESGMSTPPPPPAKKSGSRALFFIIPGGCLVILLICGGGGYFLFRSMMDAFMNAEPMIVALDRARQNPEVVAALGEPIDISGFPAQANLQTVNGNVTAQYEVGITGPNGSARMIVDGSKPAGADAWTFAQLEVVLNDGTRIDLRDGTNAPSNGR